MKLELGVSWRVGFVSTEWINNKVLLYSTGNYVINHNGKEHKKHTYVCAVLSCSIVFNSCNPIDCSLPWSSVEKEIATYSRVLAWRIPGMGKPGGLLSMGLHRVGHVWSDLAAAAAAGSSAPWVLQARVLEWVAIYFSRRSSWPRNQTQVSCIAGRFLTNWATSEAMYC